jgi:hypothetical protein
MKFGASERSPRAWYISIERRIVLALCLVEALGMERELVPEPVEINTLTARDQAFHIRAAEAEVPHARILNDLLPGLYSWKRRVDWYEASDPVRVSSGEGITNHIPISCVTKSARDTPRATITPATSRLCIFLS